MYVCIYCIASRWCGRPDAARELRGVHPPALDRGLMVIIMIIIIVTVVIVVVVVVVVITIITVVAVVVVVVVGGWGGTWDVVLWDAK